MVKTLYRSCELGTLARGDRSHSDRARAALDSLARTVSTLLRPSCAAARAADVRAWRVQRQRSEVDAGDVGPCHRPDHLPRLSAFHHARGLGRRPDLATAPRGTARAPGRVDHRRHQLSQTGDALGRRGASGTCGALGKIANCQVAVTAALWTGARAWMIGALLYLPKPWLERRRPTRGGADSDRRGLPGEMASGADVDSPRPRRGAGGHGGARRRRVRRRHHVQASAAPLASAVCRRRLSASHRVSRHAGGPCPAESAHGPATIAAGARARHAAHRRPRVGAGACPRARGDG